MILALELKKSLSREKLTFMAIPLVDEQTEIETIPTEIHKVLNEYVGIILPELPKTLPTRRGIDHEIELVPRTKPPANNAYRMAPPELAKLRKQLDELLAAGFIRSAMGLLCCFKRRKMGLYYCA
ncbi:reverse transcriptase [Cucumis melo var. makuwa]|uniref:Reverse transcriptase n=1 Tax=Cucumis melo var. makuwa TaxID=1194695 RepID=A0A5A7UZX4_CUCMM|nr:reverse transcriptase [Cucumis melo var. makuwa]TYK02287.1 reverse transcriptase [Cucumis melo var. makuwa]